jgi:hypothetical protein
MVGTGVRDQGLRTREDKRDSFGLVGFVLSHPSRKNKDAARVGHPDCAGLDWKQIPFGDDKQKAHNNQKGGRRTKGLLIADLEGAQVQDGLQEVFWLG